MNEQELNVLYYALGTFAFGVSLIIGPVIHYYMAPHCYHSNKLFGPLESPKVNNTNLSPENPNKRLEERL